MKNFRTETLAGITNFVTMSYIFAVNPAVLSSPGTGMPFDGVLAATVLLSFLMTLFMGLYADLPFSVAPGMGVNAFFAYTIILGQKVPWDAALGIIFWAGILFVVTSITRIRIAIVSAIPAHLRKASAGGIGLFLSFIGLKAAGIVAPDPVTIVTAGPLGTRAALCLLGFSVTFLLLKKKNPFAFLAGIFVITICSWALGMVELPPSMIRKPNFESVFFKLDIWGALKLSLLPAIFSIFFTDFFDSVSTFIGVAEASGLTNEQGQPLRLKQGLVVDAFATLFAGLFGTSSGTALIESSSGVEMGGRTGLTSVVTAICILPCLFFSPVAEMIPLFATAPVLIILGMIMFRTTLENRVTSLEDIFPSFLTIILIPLTFSITQGILWGFISHSGLYVLAGRGKEVSNVMYGLAFLSLIMLGLERFH